MTYIYIKYDIAIFIHFKTLLITISASFFSSKVNELARLVTEGLDVLESSISNFINVGQWQKYGLKFFFLKSR